MDDKNAENKAGLETAESRLGYIIKNIQNTDETEYKHFFCIDQNTFLQKFIPKKTMKKYLLIEPDVYFNGLVFADYFSNIIVNQVSSDGVFDNLNTISKKFGSDKAGMLLDMDIMIAECALYAKNFKFPEKRIADIQATFDSSDSKINTAVKGRSIDPYYEAIGLMVCDMMGKDNLKYIENIKSRNDIKSLIFTGNIISYIKSQHLDNIEKTQDITNLLEEGKYLNASIKAVEILAELVSRDDLENQIRNKLLHGGAKKDPAKPTKKDISPAVSGTIKDKAKKIPEYDLPVTGIMKTPGKKKPDANPKKIYDTILEGDGAAGKKNKKEEIYKLSDLIDELAKHAKIPTLEEMDREDPDRPD